MNCTSSPDMERTYEKLLLSFSCYVRRTLRGSSNLFFRNKCVRYGRRHEHIAGDTVLCYPCEYQFVYPLLLLSDEGYWRLGAMSMDPQNASLSGKLQPAVDVLLFDIGLPDCQIGAGHDLLGPISCDFEIGTLPADMVRNIVDLIRIRFQPTFKTG